MTPEANRRKRVLTPGTMLGRYVVREKLGAGGMALVYRARDPVLQRELAIKVIRPRLRGNAARDRLLREAQAMARLEHPNVVPVFDVGTTGGSVYLVMPRLPGGTLSDWLASERRPWRAVLARFLAAGRGLAAAHAKGLVHRDFKPDNVLLGGSGEVRVADFGLAQFEAWPVEEGEGDEPAAPALAHLTRTGTVLGTPMYMAPEQLCGEPVDARTDQFSFCVALWEGLYGERPFRSPEGQFDGTESLLAAIQRGPQPPASHRGHVPLRLRALLARGLRTDPAARWPSLQELLDRAEAQLRRPRQIAAAAAVFVIASIGLTATAALSRSAEWGLRHVPPAASAAGARLVDDAHRGRRAFRTSRVTARGRVTNAALSRDGSHLAFGVQDGVFIQSTLPPPGPAQIAQPRLLLRDAPDPTLTFTPDGDRLAVTNPPGRTRVLDVKTGAVLIDASVGQRYLGFVGPDALVFQGSANELTLRRLTSMSRGVKCALPPIVGDVNAITTDAVGRVLLVADRDDGRSAILRTGADCSQPLLLREDSWLDAVATGPDRVYGLRRADGDVSLVSMMPDGRVIDSRRLDGDATYLAGVAPDGRAYFIRTDYEWRLLQVDGAGAAVELTSGMQPTELVGSPDGSQVAWVEDGDGRRALRVAPVERMSDRPPPIATGVMTVAWSPDGEQLAAILEANGHVEVIVLDLRGAVQARHRVSGIDVEDFMSWYAPDALVALTLDRRRLVRIDLATGDVEPLIEDRGVVADPQPGPDGAILFSWDRDDGGSPGVWLRAPDGALTLIRPYDPKRYVHGAWTDRGRAMLVYDRESGEVWKLPRVRNGAGAATRAPNIPLSGRERMFALWTREPGRVVAHVIRTSSDIHVSAPE